MKRAAFVYVVLMLALATLLAYPIAVFVPGEVEAFVFGYLVAVFVTFTAGASLWKKVRRMFRA